MEETALAYDLLMQRGRIVDGSGMPAGMGDMVVRNGKIVEVGKLSGQATRTIDAAGLVWHQAASIITAITMPRYS